jgi:isoamylase
MRVRTFAVSSFLAATLVGLPPSPPAQAAEHNAIETGDSGETRYGAHIDNRGGVHFVVFAPDATGVELVLFDAAQDRTPSRAVPMVKHDTDWKVRVAGDGIGAGLLYMYRAKGPNRVSVGDQFEPMFNDHYFLSDPYADQTGNVKFSTVFAALPDVHAGRSIYAGGGKSVVYDHSADVHPGHASVRREDLVIYELHVQDFTARIRGLDPAKRGTYLGLAEPGLKTPSGLTAGIDHLVELGVTAVELMPVMEYDEDSGNEPGRFNHWGYMTTNFFAPETRYASDPDNDVVELKQLIKAFHDRGIAVFLDVAYNHGGEQSPWVEDGKVAAKYYNFMGLCNTRVYKPTGDGRFYLNNTGTGNDIDFDGPDGTFPKRVVTDSLGLWHQTYGVDGFRFDLALILAEGSNNAADWVDNDPDYRAAALHAEPWDLAGVWYDFMDSGGFSFANNRWAKWIGHYRDEIRNFSKSTLKSRSTFKRHIEGYGTVDGGGPASTKPWRSVNFLAVHDGYTLRDCVFFNDNGGSHNCWDSGRDENLRREREKLLLGILFTSQGVPLIQQGDEFGQTHSHARNQGEAHNTYNYESTTGDARINNVNHLDWLLKEGNNSESPNGPTYGKELFHWTKDLIRLRKKWSHFRREEFPEFVAEAQDGGRNAGGANDGRFTYSWDGPPDGNPTQVAVIWWGKPGEPDLMVIYNEDPAPLTVRNLGDWSRGDWKILARSWFGNESDFGGLDDLESLPAAAGGAIEVKGRSVAILISDND